MTTRSKPIQSESQMQRSCVTWFRLQHRTKVLFAIPNGGKRGKIEAAIMQGEGVVAGVADLFLMFGNGEYNGFFLEAKVGNNTQSEKQKAFEQYCIKYKFKYAVFRSLDEFITLVNTYINSNEMSGNVRKSEI